MTERARQVVLARRELVALPVADLLGGRLPPVCAVSGLPAEEILPVRVRGRRTPLWLLFLGVAPYVVVRVLLGSGGTGPRVGLPVTRAVADRLAMAQTAAIASMVVAVASMFATVPLGALALVPLAPALVVFAIGSLTDSAMSVRPTLSHGVVTMRVSHQLRDAIVASRQRV